MQAVSQLKVRHLAKSYRSRQVVKNVSLDLTAGEIVGLLGPNGAGKTTSFYMIIGLVSANAGEVWLNDKNIIHLPMHQRARLGIGYLPQEASVFRKLSVADNIMAVLQLRKELSKLQRRALLEKLLEEFHLTHLYKHLGITLSGGERRRVEIARALATEPQFILLDEPFAGIDPISVIDIKRIIQHLATRHIGVLITDHNVRETLGVCEKAYIVNDGMIIAEGSPQAILNNKKVREVYLGHEFDL